MRWQSGKLPGIHELRKRLVALRLAATDVAPRRRKKSLFVATGTRPEQILRRSAGTAGDHVGHVKFIHADHLGRIPGNDMLYLLVVSGQIDLAVSAQTALAVS